MDESERALCSCGETYRNGETIKVGDYVSQPTYPRGRMRGWVVKHPRAFCWECKGAVFGVRHEDGTLYGLSGKAKPMRSQKPPPADLVLEVPAGTAERLGWKIGDRVTVDPPARP